MIREALLQLEKTMSRRQFLHSAVGGAGLVAVLDRFGEKLFGAQANGAFDDQSPLGVYSAIGNIVIPIDQDPGWASFEPDITEYGLNVFVKQALFAGDNQSYQGVLSTFNVLNQVPVQLGIGPVFTELPLDVQIQYFGDILGGQFENYGVQDVVFLAAFVGLFTTKAVFFSNFPNHLAQPGAEFQVRPDSAIKTGWDIMHYKGPVGPDEEKSLRAQFSNIEVLPGVDPSNPYI